MEKFKNILTLYELFIDMRKFWFLISFYLITIYKQLCPIVILENLMQGSSQVFVRGKPEC